MLYLLDANVLIDANRDYYPMTRIPEFWIWLAHRGRMGLIKIPVEVHDELKEGKPLSRSLRRLWRNSRMRFSRLKWLLALLVIIGCASSNPWYESADSIPQTDVEKLIQAAMRRGVVVEKDIPGYGLIRNKRHILLQNVRVPMFGFPEPQDSIPLTFAPQFQRVIIDLASPAEIATRAEESGDFLYLVVGAVDVWPDSALIEVGLHWAQSHESRSRVVYLSGGGYKVLYRKQNGEWIFARVISSWQS